MAGNLVFQKRAVIEGRRAWRFSTPTLESGWKVEVDDATGEAVVLRWGVR